MANGQVSSNVKHLISLQIKLICYGEMTMVMPSMDMPTYYIVRVQGIIDPRWETRLGGMHVTINGVSDESYESVLTGELPDQAALNGVLSALYGLGYRLVSVQSHIPIRAVA